MAMPAMKFSEEDIVEERIARLEVNVENIRANVQRLETKVDRLDAKIDGVDKRLSTKIDEVNQLLSGRIGEVKDSVASLALQMERSLGQMRVWFLLMGAGLLAVIARAFNWI